MLNPHVSQGQRVREARNSKKLTQEALGKILNITNTAISHIENNKSQLTTENALIISQHCDVNVEWLLYGKLPKENTFLQVVRENFVPYNENTSVLLPFVPVPARASFIEMSGDEKSYGEFKTHPVTNPPPEIQGKKAFVIEIDGDSMEPQLKKGARVLAVEVDKGDWVFQSSKVFAVAYANTFVVKRIKNNSLMSENRITLSSDNPNGGEITISGKEIRGMWKVLKVVDADVE